MLQFSFIKVKQGSAFFGGLCGLSLALYSAYQTPELSMFSRDVVSDFGLVTCKIPIQQHTLY